MSASYMVAQTAGGIVAGQQYTFIGWVNIPLTVPFRHLQLNLNSRWLDADERGDRHANSKKDIPRRATVGRKLPHPD